MLDNNLESESLRYTNNELFEEPTAQIKYFHPESKGRDKFGNRVFTSPSLGYVDRQGDNIKAALLVSPEGESFIQSHKGILRDIEQGLLKFETQEDSHSIRNEVIVLPTGFSLRTLANGGQSNVYILEAENTKYIVKTHKKPYFSSDMSQPYSNEMLQSQAVSADLGNDLDALKIQLPKFLFASGQISCTLYEEGDEAILSDLIDKKGNPESDRIMKLWRLVNDYIIAEKESGNHLWDDVYPDLFIESDDLLYDEIKTDNFIKSSESKLVWIDPFSYQEPDYEEFMNDMPYYKR